MAVDSAATAELSVSGSCGCTSRRSERHPSGGGRWAVMQARPAKTVDGNLGRLDRRPVAERDSTFAPDERVSTPNGSVPQRIPTPPDVGLNDKWRAIRFGGRPALVRAPARPRARRVYVSRSRNRKQTKGASQNLFTLVLEDTVAAAVRVENVTNVRAFETEVLLLPTRL